ncbi:MAG: hypothetical protein NC131_06190 [Roseburia sp.]|nr:hypothetical protein [Roseburia sp.]
MLGNVPDPVVKDNSHLLKLSDNILAWKGTTRESVEAYGLFGGDIDYNTYYPNLDLKDLAPKEAEFINPMFRLLSATIVSKNYNPTDFSQPGVLKASMPLLLGQTVNCDHSTDIGNAIGAVSKVTWQESYKADNGFIIPAGINGILKIDGKANPRIARGILMDPPSIHSNSVTVQFRWDKSHPEMDDRDFYEKLGTYDAKGNMIRRMVTEIVRYMETSLVSHGADSFAQKIGDNGHIINPTYAQRAWGSYKEYDEDKSKQYFFYDIKQDVDSYQEKSDDTQVSPNNNEDISNSTKKEDMNKELQEFLEKLFGTNMLTLGEGKEATTEEAISLIQGLVTDKASLTEQVTNLTTEKTQLAEKVANLEAEVVSLKPNAAIGETYVKSLRETAVNNYKKMQGDKFDEKDPILTMLNAETTGATTLEALNKTYEQRLNELFPVKCNKCGSKDVGRASSIQENEDEDEDKVTLEEPRSTSDVMAQLIAKSRRGVKEIEE